MRTEQTPLLDGRDAEAVRASLLRRLPAYVPGWRPAATGPSQAMLQIAARYAQVLIERLNAVADKNKLGFLDALGITENGPAPARAPIVFDFQPPAPPALPSAPAFGTGNGALPVPTALPSTPIVPPEPNIRVAAGTQVAAKTPDGQEVIFETESAIGLIGGRLSQVVSLWPGRDTYADHTSDLAEGKPVVLFAAAGTTPHHLYIGHERLFALSGESVVDIEFDLAPPSAEALTLQWEYWDGQGWHAFGDPDLAPSTDDDAPPAATPGIVEDGTEGLTRSGAIRLSSDCVDSKPATVNGIETYWLRARLLDPMPPDPGRTDALLRRLRAGTVVRRLFDPDGLDASVTVANIPVNVGVTPDAAMANGADVDLSKAFAPFGQVPQPGSVFHFSSEEVFSKPGAEVRLAIGHTDSPQGEAPATGHVIAWEYFDGRVWLELTVEGSGGHDFASDEVAGFVVPEAGIPVTNVMGKDGRWVRARLASGGYFTVRTVAYTDENEDPQTLTITENRPPMVSLLKLAYSFSAPKEAPQACLTFNDFTYVDRSREVQWPSAGFPVLYSVSDRTPSLYLGFDRAFPVDFVSLFVDVEEQPPGVRAAPLLFEYWDGLRWLELSAEDETANLARPGVIGFLGPADGVAFARFGRPLHWFRARLREDGTPTKARMRAVLPNAAVASQTRTVRNEVLGGGNGEAGQTFFLRQRPVLAGEVIEVRELEGARATVELPILAREVPEEDIRVERRNATATEVWVRWHPVPHFYRSSRQDRHYSVDSASGRIVFGARPVLPGSDNVRALRYRTGGGRAGNLAAGAINQMLAGIPYVSAVYNPRAAEGGADGDGPVKTLAHGPQAVRHRDRAVSQADWEALAIEASPAVAVARALCATHPSGRREAGWVMLIVIPESTDPRPQPSFGLRQDVQAYLEARMPAGSARVGLVGPAYLPIGVAAAVVPLDARQAGPVAVALDKTLRGFFHPLTGGPGGQGWPFGRHVFLSDVAAAIERVPGVDYVEELELLLDGITAGESIEVPDDRIVCAGEMRLRLKAGEG